MANQALTRIKKGVGIGSYRPGDIEGGGNKSLRRQGIEPGGKSPVFPFRKEEVDLDEGAPKMKSDFIKTQREKDRAHDDAMGRTPTGRKKPVRHNCHLMVANPATAHRANV